VLPVRPPVQSVAERPPVLSPLGYGTYRWIAEHLPPDARVLSNGWTDGAFATVAQRAGIVDGPAPYADGPEALTSATARLLGARRLFAEPGGPGAASFADRENVEFLLVATARPGDLGASTTFATDVDALRGDSGYVLIQSFGDDRLLLFRVLR
jgi:hypothetical protein